MPRLAHLLALACPLALTGCFEEENRPEPVAAAPAHTAAVGPRPWAIDDAVHLRTSMDLLRPGDLFIGEADPVEAADLAASVWAMLTSVPGWIAEDPLFSYSFEERGGEIAFRFTGLEDAAGTVTEPLDWSGVGTYVSASGTSFDALLLKSRDECCWELLVVQDAGAFVHAVQLEDGLPELRSYLAE